MRHVVKLEVRGPLLHDDARLHLDVKLIDVVRGTTIHVPAFDHVTRDEHVEIVEKRERSVGRDVFVLLRFRDSTGCKAERGT